MHKIKFQYSVLKWENAFATCTFYHCIQHFIVFSSSLRHTFKVTKEALLDLYHHTMEVRVWNSKDKLSARARYDQPKAFRLPATASKNEQHIGVESGDEGRTSPRPAYFVVINHTEVSSNVFMQVNLGIKSVYIVYISWHVYITFVLY